MLTKRMLMIAVLGALILMTAAHAGATVPWVRDLATAQQIAARENRLVLVHFWTPTCHPCLLLDRNVFSQPYVGQAVLADFVPVKVDSSRDPGIAQKFGVRRWPTDVVLSPNGQIVQVLNCPQDPGQYVAQLRSVVAQASAARAATHRPPAAGRVPAGQPNWGAGQNIARPAAVGVSGTMTDPNRGGALPADGGRYGQQGPSYADRMRGQQPPQHASTSPPVADNWRQEYGAAGGQPYPPRGGSRPGADFADPRPPANANSGQWRDTPGGNPGGPRPNGPARPERRPEGRPSGQFATAQAPSATLGFEGFCPVTLRKGTWQKGDPEYGAVHRGKTYLFAGPEEQKQFMARPDEMAPVLSGYDPVEFFDNGRIVEGKRQHGLDYEGYIYMFSSEKSLEKFARAPRSYVINAMQTMYHGAQ